MRLHQSAFWNNRSLCMLTIANGNDLKKTEHCRFLIILRFAVFAKALIFKKN
jgi:hypothetical protein